MIDAKQRAQREKGLCERRARVCNEPARVIVTPKKEPGKSRRYCDFHAHGFLKLPAYHVGRIEVRTA